MKHIPLLALLSLLVTACSSSQQESIQDQAKQPQVTPEMTPAKKPARIIESNFRGQLVMGEDEQVFIPCGTGSEFVVQTNKQLSRLYQQISDQEYQAVYMEFSGELIGSEASKAELRVDRIHHMALAKTSPQCAKPVSGFLFRAFGEEPYWNTRIVGQKLMLDTPSSNQKYHIDRSQFETTQKNSLTATNENGYLLVLNISPGECYNPRTKTYWGYTANIKAAWGAYTGCGEPGWPVTDPSLTGHYHGVYQSAADEKMETELELRDNYSATITYGRINRPGLTETGYWKTNDPEVVTLLLTERNNKHIQREISFTRQGLGLFANIHNLAGQDYRLGKTGLQLDKMTGAKPHTTQGKVYIPREFSAENINPAAKIDAEITRAIAEYFRYHRTDPADSKFTAVKYDLNDDGYKDALVLLNWCNKQGCVALIFSGGPDGYSFLSRTEQVKTPIQLAQEQHYDWQNLQANTQVGWVELLYDGVSYPGTTKGLSQTPKPSVQTGVVFFSNGLPKIWTPIPK